MAIQPGIYNMNIQRRSDHSIQLVFKDSDNNAINLVGFTVEAQVWEETRTTKFADFADVQTATFSPNILKYDVLLTNPAGLKEYYLEGDIFMSEGYTA